MIKIGNSTITVGESNCGVCLELGEKHRALVQAFKSFPYARWPYAAGVLFDKVQAAADTRHQHILWHEAEIAKNR